MNVAIGSKNPAKINAVKETFSLLEEKNMEFISVDVPSGVSTQPFSDEETLQGALNRAKNVFEKVKPDLSVGLEGGVDVTSRGLFLCNWGALIDKDGNEYIAGGARIHSHQVKNLIFFQRQKHGILSNENHRWKGLFFDGKKDEGMDKNDSSTLLL
ncbi:DUF84 family protein [Aeribacillus sp. FSL M8-0254]|uniref:DUF84 family protein n=1 Tax=Aeribacillus sp. FSL M8-0254 TaxID=2954577 RepID=UPI0030FBF7B0